MRDIPRHWRMTWMDLCGFHFGMDLRIRSPLPPRMRRALALSFFKTMRPWIHYMATFRLAHCDWIESIHKVDDRGILDEAHIDFDHEPYRIGFRIRTARLILRLTLKQVGSATGIPYSHLSLIERGLVKPRAKTLQRLYDALHIELPSAPRPDAPPKYRGRTRWKTIPPSF